MNIDYKSIGKRVRSNRTHQRMTQAELAEKTGMSDVYISRIETGTRSPSLGSLLKIALILGISLDSLVLNAPITSLPKEFRKFSDLLADCDNFEREQIIKNARAFKKMLREK
jgi:transcriptional regulator with XRE-family HTH domain